MLISTLLHHLNFDYTAHNGFFVCYYHQMAIEVMSLSNHIISVKVRIYLPNSIKSRSSQSLCLLFISLVFLLL